MLVAVGAVCGCLLAGGVAWATIGSGGVIQGCYDSGGNLKVVNALPCPKGYTGLQWNQQGPAGKDGAPGVSGREIVQQSAVPRNGIAAAAAQCPTGKVTIGGGAALGGEVQDSTGTVTIFASRPHDSDWFAAATQPSGYTGTWELTTYVICATVDS